MGAGAVIIVLHLPLIEGALWIAPASDQVESMAKVYADPRVQRACDDSGLWSDRLACGAGADGKYFSDTIGYEPAQYGAERGVCFGAQLGCGRRRPGHVHGRVDGIRAGIVVGARRVSQWRVEGWPLVFDRVRLWHMMAVNRDILLRSVLLMAGFTAFIFLSQISGTCRLRPTRS